MGDELRRLRAAAQLLHRPARASASDVVRALLAVQAQDLRAARLALRARTEGLAAAGVDAALSVDRSLVVAWLARGTLHLVCAEDYPWLLALTAPGRFANSRRRLGQEGVSEDDAERAVGIVEASLADEGPLTRDELGERIAARGIRTEGQATPHLLMLAALRGVTVLGPLREGRQAFVLARDWLGERPEVEREVALGELARRYLAGHGPAEDRDLAAWSGLPLRDARAGLERIVGQLSQRDDGLVDLPGRHPARHRIPARLLPAFDPYMLGWRDRSFAVPSNVAKKVQPGGGMLRAVATDDGIAVGTWAIPGGSVKLEPFARLTPELTRALEEEAADVARFEGR